jgi:hypothetical protein
MQLAKRRFASDNEFVIDVLDVRAHVRAGFALGPVSLLHQGCTRLLMSSDVQRRVRESHFVAIVTPTIKHLRKEMPGSAPWATA